MDNVLGVCACGKETSFRGLAVGFDSHCSIKCSANSKETREKYADTCIDRYGVVSKSKTDEYKEATKEANLLKYGVESRCRTEEFKEKSKQTCLIKYGTERASQNADVIEKGKKTCIERFGVEFAVLLPTTIENRNRILKEKFGESGSPFTDEVNRIKSRETFMTRYGVLNTLSKGSPFTRSIVEKTRATVTLKTLNTHIPLFALYNCDNVSYTDEQFTFTCNKCNNVIIDSYSIAHIRLLAKQEPCTICNPRIKYSSMMEKELGTFIKTFNHDVIENTNEIISPKELDIYVPEKQLAFEFNGLYHHSESFKPSNYHLRKTELCIDKNIRLIHVFEDDWLYKKEIVKSRISSVFGITDKIFARKCIIKNLTSNETNTFLDINHLQGKCQGKYRYGLFYNDELVAVMTFGMSRFKASEVELLRYCNKLNTTVVGGASRLFKYFIKQHNEIDEVISYADRCWSVGNLYESIGFQLESITQPNYYYIIDGLKENRMNYQKHKLVTLGFDANKSEHEIMLDRNIYRIYDSGNLKYKWVK